MHMHFEQQPGFIALVALLMIAAVGLTLGITASLSGIGEIQTSYAFDEAQQARYVTNACIEEGLEQLRRNWVPFNLVLSIDSDSCIIEAQLDGSIATLTATGTVDIYYQKIKIQVDDSFNVAYWQEE